MAEAPTPPSLAVFDEGAARNELEFKIFKENSGFIVQNFDAFFESFLQHENQNY